MAPAVTVVGSLNLDLLVTVGRLPGRGETVVGSASATAPGGKGANQAAAAGVLCAGSSDDAGRSGSAGSASGAGGVAMVGRVGDDAAGRDLIADLAVRGVDTSHVLITSGTLTGHATVAVESSGGENLIVVAPGANALLSATDVDVPIVRGARVVLAQLEVPLETVLAAVSAARGLVVLNPAPSQPLPKELLDRVDVLVPNEWELAQLAGAAPGRYAVAELATMARQVSPRDVVITLGARGALVVPGASGPDGRAVAGEPVLVAPPAVNPVDTTGAGDCFCAALSVALSRGGELVAAARYAVAAAALSTTGAGARGFLPDDAAVRAVL